MNASYHADRDRVSASYECLAIEFNTLNYTWQHIWRLHNTRVWRGRRARVTRPYKGWFMAAGCSLCRISSAGSIRMTDNVLNHTSPPLLIRPGFIISRFARTRFPNASTFRCARRSGVHTTTTTTPARDGYKKIPLLGRLRVIKPKNQLPWSGRDDWTIVRRKNQNVDCYLLR